MTVSDAVSPGESCLQLLKTALMACLCAEALRFQLKGLIGAGRDFQGLCLLKGFYDG